MDMAYEPPRKKAMVSASTTGEEAGDQQGSKCNSLKDRCESWGNSGRKHSKEHVRSSANPILSQVAESLSNMVKVQQQMLNEMRDYHEMMLEELRSMHQTIRGSPHIVRSRSV